MISGPSTDPRHGSSQAVSKMSQTGQAMGRGQTTHYRQIVDPVLTRGTAALRLWARCLRLVRSWVGVRPHTTERQWTQYWPVAQQLSGCEQDVSDWSGHGSGSDHTLQRDSGLSTDPRHGSSQAVSKMSQTGQVMGRGQITHYRDSGLSTDPWHGSSQAVSKVSQTGQVVLVACQVCHQDIRLWCQMLLLWQPDFRAICQQPITDDQLDTL